MSCHIGGSPTIVARLRLCTQALIIAVVLSSKAYLFSTVKLYIVLRQRWCLQVARTTCRLSSGWPTSEGWRSSLGVAAECLATSGLSSLPASD